MRPRYSIPVIILVSLLIYGNTIKGGFVWDDHFFIVERSPIQSIENIPFFFTTNIARGTTMPHSVPYYRPLHMSSMAVQYALWGKDPIGYHAVNVLLHAVIAMLVYLLARRLSLNEPGSLAAALIYSVHPVHSEAVAYLGSNSELQYTLFYLAALIGYLRFRERGGPAGIIVPLALYLCSLLTKESAATFPLLLVAVEAADPCGSLLRIAGRISLFGAASLAYLAVRVQYVKHISWMEIPFTDRLYTSFGIIGRYVLNLVAPVDLKVLYDIPLKVSFTRWDVVLPCIGIVLLTLATAYSYRKSRTVFLSGTMVVVTMLPASGLPAILLPSPMADRYLTLPLAGFAVLVGLLADRVVNRTAIAKGQGSGVASRGGRFPVSASLFAMAFVLLGALTVHRNLLWKDHETLVRRMTTDAPGHFMGHELLGTLLGKQGEYDAMARSYHTSEQVSLERNLELGSEYLRLGRPNEATVVFEKLMKKFSSDPRVLNGMGESLLVRGRPFEALEYFRLGLSICPNCREIEENIKRIQKSGNWNH